MSTWNTSGEGANNRQQPFLRGVSLVVAVPIIMGACHDFGPESTLPDSSHSAPIGISATRPSDREQASSRLIARAIAAAASDSATRLALFEALASTRNPEHKLHLNSFLSGRGNSVTRAAQKAGVSAAALQAAVAEVRELELYMPVAAHRTGWRSSVAPLVAVSMSDTDPPLATDQNGSEVPLRSDFPPSQPVLVLVPNETDLSAQAVLNMAGHSENHCVTESAESLEDSAKRCERAAERERMPTRANALGDVIGLFMEHIEIYGDQCHAECWWFGDPEYELHVRYASSPGQARSYKQCIGANAPTGYQWDMNGSQYTGNVKLLNGAQLDTAMASGGFFIEMWEDDTDACHVKSASLGENGTVETLAGLLFVAVGLAAEDPESTDSYIIAGAFLTAAVIDFLNGGDDPIGAVLAPQGSLSVTGSNTHLIVRGNVVGQVRLKVNPSNPPTAGPTVAVQISQSSGTFVPIGYMVHLDAGAIDANGVGAPDRTASWSSSNTSVASVGSDGWVSGNSQGSATITATIDGVSASITVSVSLAATVVGPSTVTPYDYHEYSASINGGAAPYAYQWFVNGSPWSTATTLDISFGPSTVNSIIVEITDADGATISTDPYFIVNVTSGGGGEEQLRSPEKKPVSPGSASPRSRITSPVAPPRGNHR